VFVKVHYDLRVFSPQFQVQCVDTLYLVTNAYAARAKNAPVSVDNQKIMRGINLLTRPVALKYNVVNAQLIRQALQLAVIIRNAD
jgi:hypothetical protein